MVDSEQEVAQDESDDRLGPLNRQQQTRLELKVERFEEYLREDGKSPEKGIGYAEGSVGERVSRMMRLFKWVWEHLEVTTELSATHADQVMTALAHDEFTRLDGQPFDGGTKRKFSNVLKNWCEFTGTEWTPGIRFQKEGPADQPDPFTKQELRRLTEVSLNYKSIPSYNNLSPEQRDRWKAYLAQELGVSKAEITPDDWAAVGQRWDVPSLVRTAREAGWRPDLVGRLPVDWYEPTQQVISIPAGEATKNDDSWRVALSDEAADFLNQWLDQRATMAKYDGRDELWLNRKGNPHTSETLNTMLRNLIEQAGIPTENRKLVWYSFRHSIGSYVYEEYKSLRPVAERLRQKSTKSAAHYVHTTTETKKDIARVM